MFQVMPKADDPAVGGPSLLVARFCGSTPSSSSPLTLLLAIAQQEKKNNAAIIYIFMRLTHPSSSNNDAKFSCTCLCLVHKVICLEKQTLQKIIVRKKEILNPCSIQCYCVTVGHFRAHNSCEISMVLLFAYSLKKLEGKYFVYDLHIVHVNLARAASMHYCRVLFSRFPTILASALKKYLRICCH
jgi:hypothetical protein